MRREWRRAAGFLGKAVAVLIGLLVGRLITGSAPYRDLPLFPLWAATAVALTATAGLLVPWGLDRWRELNGIVPIRPRQAALAVALVLLTGCAAAVIPRLALDEVPGAGPRGSLLVLASAVGAAPVAATMLATRLAAHTVRDREGYGRWGEKLADLCDLRRLLQRLLPALGSIVALSTFALGASRLVIAAVPVSRRTMTPLPPEAVLLFGLSVSLVVGVLYVSSSTALRTVAIRLAEDMAEVRSAATAAEALERAERRRQLLSQGRSPVALGLASRPDSPVHAVRNRARATWSLQRDQWSSSHLVRSMGDWTRSL